MDYQNSTNMAVAGFGYPGSTISMPETQRQKEIPAKLELVDKLLHELSEEALGMNGTFASVLATAPAAQTNGGAPKAAHATQIADTLDSFATRIQQATLTLRDIRSRCEL